MALDWKAFKTAATGIGILGTLAVSVVTLVMNAKDRKHLEAIQQEQQKLLKEQVAAKHALEQLKYVNEYNLSVYKEVVSALREKDTKLEAAATALVTAMPEESSLRTGLLSAIYKGTASPEIRKLVQFETEEPSFTTFDQRDQDRWNVDVFYCEGEGNGASNAQAIADALKQQDRCPVGTTRARLLPTNVNDRAGYRVAGLQIRYEHDEESAATNCQQAVNDILKAKDLYPGSSISLRTVASRTPSYLSIFLCTSAAPK